MKISKQFKLRAIAKESNNLARIIFKNCDTQTRVGWCGTGRQMPVAQIAFSGGRGRRRVIRKENIMFNI